MLDVKYLNVKLKYVLNLKCWGADSWRSPGMLGVLMLGSTKLIDQDNLFAHEKV